MEATAQPLVQVTQSQPGTTNTVTKIPAQSVPSDWASLGVETGYKPLSVNQLRMFILGPEGQGKTTFIAGSPKTLILDYEGGAWGIPNPRAHRIHVTTFEMQHRFTDKLVADAKAGRRFYDRIVFDTIDQLVELMNDELSIIYKDNLTKGIPDIRNYGQKGAGYVLLARYCWDEIQKVEKAGYAWTCTGHLTEKTITIGNTDRTVIRPVVSGTISDLVGRNCEVVATINQRQESVEFFREIQGRKISGGFNTIQATYLEATTMNPVEGVAQGKVRGVPPMRTKILLPNPMTGEQGWDKFAAAYDEAAASVINTFNPFTTYPPLTVGEPPK